MIFNLHHPSSVYADSERRKLNGNARTAFLHHRNKENCNKSAILGQHKNEDASSHSCNIMFGCGHEGRSQFSFFKMIPATVKLAGRYIKRLLATPLGILKLIIQHGNADLCTSTWYSTLCDKSSWNICLLLIMYGTGFHALIHSRAKHWCKAEIINDYHLQLLMMLTTLRRAGVQKTAPASFLTQQKILNS